MSSAGERPITKRQQEVLAALARLRDRGVYPATVIEVAREAGYKDEVGPYRNGTRTRSAATRVTTPLHALENHGLVEQTGLRGGGYGKAWQLVPHPHEEFVRWVISIERDTQLARTVTLRQIVERAKKALRDGE